MTAAVVTLAIALVGVMPLVAWLVHRSLAEAAGRAASEVATAQLRADLQLAQADAATYRRAHAAQVAVTRQLEEVARHAVAQLSTLDPGAGAHGLDRLQAALAVTAQPAAGADGDRSAAGPAGLPGGAGPEAGRGDPGTPGGHPAVPSTGWSADELK